MKSQENFEISLRIKEKNGKVISLNKGVVLEVEWKGRKGKVITKEIVFEKDGENFRFIIKKIEVWKNLLKCGVRSYCFEVPPNASYRIYHGEASYGSEPEISTNEKKNDYVEFTNKWKIDPAVKLLFILFLIIIVFVFVLWMFKKRNKSSI